MKRRLLTLAMVLGSLAPAAAQDRGRVELTVLDQQSGRPIPRARIDVGGLGRPVHTGDDGTVVIPVPPGGRLFVVTRLGYAPTRTLIELAAGERVSRVLSLAPEAINISGVTVRGVRRDAALDRNGFYDRERMGFGAFMTAERIDHLHPMRTIDLFRRMPGFMVTHGPAGEDRVTTVRGPISLSGGACSPVVYLDGQPLTVDASSALHLVQPDRIAGIEAFSGPASIPAQYNPSGSACGVILIWTKTSPFRG